MRLPAFLAFALFSATGCGSHQDPADPPLHIALSSSTFSDGIIPQRLACVPSGPAPALAWSVPPPETRTLVVIVRDLDSPLQWLRGPFVHWVAYDIPISIRELPEGIAPQAEFADGMRQGTNGFDKIGFGGPCPPGATPHRYEFKLYALDTVLNVPGGAELDSVRPAMQGHVLATGRLLAQYRRP